MKWWWKSIIHFFNFYPSEKRGVLILLSTFFILLLFKRYILNTILELDELSLTDKIELIHPTHYNDFPCVDFRDSLTIESFAHAQLDPNLIRRILKNYTQYGMYNCISDLSDIVGVNEQELMYLSSVCLPEFLDCPHLNINKASAKEIAFFFRININKGKTFVKYRNSIGGFVKFEQINQVYGFPKKKFGKRWKQRVDLEYREIQRLNLKTASYRSLLKHGFINRKAAVALNRILKKRPLTLEDIRNEVSDLNKPLVAYYFKQ